MTNQLTTTAQHLPPLDIVTQIANDPRLHSPQSQRQYKSVLQQFEEFRAGRDVGVLLVEEYIKTMQNRNLSPATIKQFLVIIKWWTTRITKNAAEYGTPDQYAEIERQASRVLAIPERAVVKGNRPKAGRHIPLDEIGQILVSCSEDRSPIGLRDSAWLSLAIPTGLRNEEMRELTMTDVTYTERELMIDGKPQTLRGADITIRHGKGDKFRVVFLYGRALAALDSWINLRGANPGALFCRILKAGKITNKPMTYEGSRKILLKRFSASGISDRTTWHDFRRTLAGNWFDLGLDDRSIMEQFGWANIQTARRYDHRTDEKRRAVAVAMDIPKP